MKREIKFRAWRGNAPKIEREMIYFNLYNAEEFLNPFWDTAITQYTGLKDKNGKEIYEGDIINSKEFDWNFEVCCDIWLCMGLLPINSRGFISFTQLAGTMDISNLEVIGNIYENPELLKDK